MISLSVLGLQPHDRGGLVARSESGPGLSRARVTAAGLELLESSGLGGLTMRALADRLGVKAASLYWHVRDRDELLELLADSLLGEIGLEQAGLDWQAGVRRLLDGLTAMLGRHPAAGRLLLEVPATLESSGFFAALAGRLQGAGLGEAEAREVARMAVYFALVGETRETGADSRAPGRPATLVIETGTRGVSVKSGRRGAALATSPREAAAGASVAIDGDTVTVRRLRGVGRAEVELDPERDWTVRVKGSTTGTVLALSDLAVQEIAFDGGATRIDCELPLPRDVVPVQVSGGVVGLRLHTPPAAAAHVQVSAGAMRVRLASHSILMAATDHHWEAGSGRAAPDRYEIRVTSGSINTSLDQDSPAGPAPAVGPAPAPGPPPAAAPAQPARTGTSALEILLDGVERRVGK